MRSFLYIILSVVTGNCILGALHDLKIIIDLIFSLKFFFSKFMDGASTIRYIPVRTEDAVIEFHNVKSNYKILKNIALYHSALIKSKIAEVIREIKHCRICTSGW